MKLDSITISKEVVKTLGLNEAILLETIKNILTVSNTKEINTQQILHETTFWNLEELEEYLRSLISKGLLQKKEEKIFLCEVQLKKEKDIPIHSTYSNFENREETFLEKEWEPSLNSIEQAEEYGIPKEFVLSQLREFIQFYREKKEQNRSWDIKFLRYVVKQWRFEEIKNNIETKRKPINKDWLPDQEALKILLKAGVTTEFINKEIPEFTLYWGDRGEISDTWNSKFIAQVRRQWAKSQNLIENADLPTPISMNWLPSEDFYAVLSLTDINRDFADSSIKEFILYWKETGQSHNSWNSKFFQHVKYLWEKKLEYPGKDIDKQIEANWGTKDQKEFSTDIPDKVSKERIKSKLKQLKDKHQI